MSHATERVTLGKQGRLVIPAAIRRELDLVPGAELVARVEEGRLVLEPRAAAERRLRGRFKDVVQSMADDLIAERSDEAAREQ